MSTYEILMIVGTFLSPAVLGIFSCMLWKNGKTQNEILKKQGELNKSLVDSQLQLAQIELNKIDDKITGNYLMRFIPDDLDEATFDITDELQRMEDNRKAFYKDMDESKKQIKEKGENAHVNENYPYSKKILKEVHGEFFYFIDLRNHSVKDYVIKKDEFLAIEGLSFAPRKEDIVIKGKFYGVLDDRYPLLELEDCDVNAKLFSDGYEHITSVIEIKKGDRSIYSASYENKFEDLDNMEKEVKNITALRDAIVMTQNKKIKVFDFSLYKEDMVLYHCLSFQRLYPITLSCVYN